MNIVFDIGNVLLRWDPRFLFTQYFDDEAKMEWFLAHVCNDAVESGAGPGAELCRGGEAGNCATSRSCRSHCRL